MRRKTFCFGPSHQNNRTINEITNFPTDLPTHLPAHPQQRTTNEPTTQQTERPRTSPFPCAFDLKVMLETPLAPFLFRSSTWTRGKNKQTNKRCTKGRVSGREGGRREVVEAVDIGTASWFLERSLAPPLPPHRWPAHSDRLINRPI